MRRDIALQRLITLLSLSFALYNIVLLVPSASPHIKVIFLRSTSLEVTLFLFTSFMDKEVTNLKNQKVFIINKLSSNKYLYLNTSIHHCLQLLYLTLTLHGYRLLLV